MQRNHTEHHNKAGRTTSAVRTFEPNHMTISVQAELMCVQCIAGRQNLQQPLYLLHFCGSIITAEIRSSCAAHRAATGCVLGRSNLKAGPPPLLWVKKGVSLNEQSLEMGTRQSSMAILSLQRAASWHKNKSALQSSHSSLLT